MEIQQYPKSELALMYFPKSSPHVALNHLNSWIKRCPELCRELEECHQHKYAKYYKSQAVRLIRQYLGEP